MDKDNVVSFSRLTPSLLLDEVIQDINRIKSIAVVAEAYDGTMFSGCSDMPIKDLVFLVQYLKTKLVEAQL